MGPRRRSTCRRRGGGQSDRHRRQVAGIHARSRTLRQSRSRRHERPIARRRAASDSRTRWLILRRSHLFRAASRLGRTGIRRRQTTSCGDASTCRRSLFQDFGWHTHEWNFQILKEYLPVVDRSFASLREGLDRRGLIDEMLVVVMSDFGRTPHVNKTAGRDHWIHCYSVLFAGAGIRGGTVFGASDDQAAWVKDRAVRPADSRRLVATR
ncbi:MAG: DUF1501 domain-containing protein [Planctomycetota bacterium]|nr:MAG: DUF1501 domain-containing protein [Planctomycetota bacterium]